MDTHVSNFNVTLNPLFSCQRFVGVGKGWLPIWQCPYEWFSFWFYILGDKIVLFIALIHSCVECSFGDTVWQYGTYMEFNMGNDRVLLLWNSHITFVHDCNFLGLYVQLFTTHELLPLFVYLCHFPFEKRTSEEKRETAVCLKADIV